MLLSTSAAGPGCDTDPRAASSEPTVNPTTEPKRAPHALAGRNRDSEQSAIPTAVDTEIARHYKQ
ncbi:hypothetical protein BGZ61DRAFT_470126 [Ilyonectria robusta]|uniref:uncharacterized protein n=1 Tax=Ilyonectria robusta TaxID=1079257 RepID=UPI001E8DFDC8|nr:uncharacterized protein BGZ61DRAFT_470126 [Ilyonectria robusta]KAH8645874.1 hypothetical protein BGZ61DRAFT_470126 [Ilyonectria robusta]